MDERREQLMRLPLTTLIDRIIRLENELEESRSYRRRLIQIRNLCLEPEERASRGRPKKEN